MNTYKHIQMYTYTNTHIIQTYKCTSTEIAKHSSIQIDTHTDIHTSKYAQSQVSKYTNIHTQKWTHKQTHTYLNIHIHKETDIHINIYTPFQSTNIHIHKYTTKRINTHTNKQTNTCTFIYKYTHIQIDKFAHTHKPDKQVHTQIYTYTNTAIGKSTSIQIYIYTNNQIHT